MFIDFHSNQHRGLPATLLHSTGSARSGRHPLGQGMPSADPQLQACFPAPSLWGHFTLLKKHNVCTVCFLKPNTSECLPLPYNALCPLNIWSYSPKRSIFTETQKYDCEAFSHQSEVLPV